MSETGGWSAPGVSNAAAWAERRQVPLYVAAIGVGSLVGLSAPSVAPGLTRAITPLLAALLYVTFLQVPVGRLAAGLADRRFLAAVLTVNFIVVPLVVAAMFGFLPGDPALRFGVLLVLLCPCIDYVIVFCGLAGGDARRLLAVTPVLLVAQLVALPPLLALFLGPDLAAVVEVRPFLEAFVGLIVIPLLAAWATQRWAGRRRAGAEFSRGASATMLPLMMLVLGTVVASQLPAVGHRFDEVAATVPFYVAFLLIMLLLGAGVARLFRLDCAGRRAVVFGGATRNSLVVLPLALALPAGMELAAAVVVTQTLVEVLGMVVFLRVVPALIRDREPRAPADRAD